MRNAFPRTPHGLLAWRTVAALLIALCSVPTRADPTRADPTRAEQTRAEVPGTDLLPAARVTVALAEGEWSGSVTLNPEKPTPVRARWTFQAPDPSLYHSLVLEKPLEISRWALNGRDVPLPLEGMAFRHVPGLPASMLRPGRNTLEAEWSATARRGIDVLRPEALPVRLLALKAGDLALRTGPVLGPAGTDFLTMSCRTWVPAELTVEGGGRRAKSPAGVLHTLRLEGLEPGARVRYRVTARVPGTGVTRRFGPFTARPLPRDAPYTFVALGDSRTNAQVWGRIAALAQRQDPAFVLHSGDLVGSGRNDEMWDTDFFRAAPEFFRTLPLFPVLGNHDEDAPLFHRLFDVEKGEPHWSVRIGPALFIGINARASWASGSESVRWLEKVLADSRDEYVFLVSHYAGWSSGPGGDARRGVMLDREVEEAQKNIVPLLERYRATAMIAGHSHFYERSETPAGLSILISGGAGAPLYDRRPNAAAINPYGTRFAREHHLCVFTLDRIACTLRVLNIDGQEIDARAWRPRPAPIARGGNE